jgi:hypothetical protein
MVTHLVFHISKHQFLPLPDVGKRHKSRTSTGATSLRQVAFYISIFGPDVSPRLCYAVDTSPVELAFLHTCTQLHSVYTTHNRTLNKFLRLSYTSGDIWSQTRVSSRSVQTQTTTASFCQSCQQFVTIYLSVSRLHNLHNWDSSVKCYKLKSIVELE